MILGLSACGNNPDAKRYALIENHTTQENTTNTESAWAGIQAAAASQETNGGRYMPAGDETDDYIEAIDEAVKDGAKVVVCMGEEMSVAVYMAQKDHTGTKFVLMEAEPHKIKSEKPNLKKNTCSIYFDQIYEGYLAGYAAVAEGARNIGFMGGEENETESTLLAGYIQGAEAAAADLSLSEGSVQLRSIWLGDNKVSPSHMGVALDWYKDNCEIIFAPDEGIALSAAKAAENQNKKVICAGADESALSSTILTSAVKDYAAAVENIIADYEEDKFPGEETLTYGAKEKAYTLVRTDANFASFTQERYDAMYQKLSSGEVAVSKEAPATTYVVVTAV